MRLPFKNLTIFAGYVGNEPELRALASGDVTLSLRIVAKHSWQEKPGEWRTHDEWATAVFYRALAEQVHTQGVTKGAFVRIEGRRHTRTWIQQPGNHKKVAHEIIVDDWHVIALPAGSPTSPEPAVADAQQSPGDGRQARTASRPAKAQAPRQAPPPESATRGFA